MDGAERIDEVVREVRRLSVQLEQLDARVGRLEVGGGAPGDRATPGEKAPGGAAGPAADGAEAPVAAEEPVSHRLLGQLALACFALIGALVLRVIGRQGIVSPPLGGALGLAYCALLLTLPHGLRRGPAAVASAPVLEICGAVLAAAVVTESVRRGGAFSVTLGAMVLAVMVPFSSAVATWRRSPLLAGAALLAALAGVMGLGFSSEALAIRGGTLVVIAGAGLLLARRLGQPSLRPVVVLPVMASLGAVVLLVAHRPGVATHDLALVFGAWLGVWGVIGLDRLLRVPDPGFHGLLFPLATLWAFSLGLFHDAETCSAVGLGLSALLLTQLLLSHAVAPQPSLVALAGVLPLLSALRADPGGVLLAVLALAMQRLGCRLSWSWPRRLSQGMLAGSSLLGLARWWPGQPAGVGPGWPLLASTLALTLLASLHFLLELRAEGRESWPPGVSLSCALLGAAGTLSLLAAQLLGAGPGLILARSVILAAGAVVCVIVARAARFPAARALSVACVGLLGLKLLVNDLVRLEGSLLVSAVLALGLSAGAVSLLLKAPKLRK